MEHQPQVLRSPLGEERGNGGGGGGVPINPNPASPGSLSSSPGLTPKPPNAFVPPPGAGAPPVETKPKIHAFSQAMGGKKHAENWKRKTNLTGEGATHVRSFHCKLNTESLEYMDQQINEWLDSHPDYEVKLVTSAVGEWTGKIKEPSLILNIWV